MGGWHCAQARCHDSRSEQRESIAMLEAVRRLALLRLHRVQAGTRGESMIKGTTDAEMDAVTRAFGTALLREGITTEQMNSPIMQAFIVSALSIIELSALSIKQRV